MEVIERKYDWLVFVAALIFVAAIIVMAQGCAQSHYSVKVVFNDGTIDYYQLDYKPKKDAKAIEYEGETILGVESIEIFK